MEKQNAVQDNEFYIGTRRISAKVRNTKQNKNSKFRVSISDSTEWSKEGIEKQTKESGKEGRPGP